MERAPHSCIRFVPWSADAADLRESDHTCTAVHGDHLTAANGPGGRTRSQDGESSMTTARPVLHDLNDGSAIALRHLNLRGERLAQFIDVGDDEDEVEFVLHGFNRLHEPLSAFGVQ